MDKADADRSGNAPPATTRAAQQLHHQHPTIASSALRLPESSAGVRHQACHVAGALSTQSAYQGQCFCQRKEAAAGQYSRKPLLRETSLLRAAFRPFSCSETSAFFSCRHSRPSHVLQRHQREPHPRRRANVPGDVAGRVRCCAALSCVAVSPCRGPTASAAAAASDHRPDRASCCLQLPTPQHGMASTRGC